ncbi:Tn3 family transposase [Streptomyces sp. NA02950]|uniref:Tn3 family transposase n=1 Tax=Streptomyces sp. NA02950 TaxID=2742137 RepID=UPI001590D11A|nr:Tn3 family transposase [Streptomyces sp. NA02950]QKV96985.1 Tn3 family transposase [Streptomyces sp. NA02950]
MLEVAELTGMADAFTHISSTDSGMEGFTTSLCAVLLSEACNVNLTPVIKPDVPALTRARLVQVDQACASPSRADPVRRLEPSVLRPAVQGRHLVERGQRPGHELAVS